MPAKPTKLAGLCFRCGQPLANSRAADIEGRPLCASCAFAPPPDQTPAPAIDMAPDIAPDSLHAADATESTVEIPIPVAPSAVTRRILHRAPCPACGGEMLAGQVVCPSCGRDTSVGVNKSIKLEPNEPGMERGRCAKCGHNMIGITSGKCPKCAEKIKPPTCGGCGYDLSGLRGSVCPECGKPIRGLGRRPEMDVAVREMTRGDYKKAFIILGVGFLGTIAMIIVQGIRFGTITVSPPAVPSILPLYPVILVFCSVATSIAYWLCGFMWLGLDDKLQVIALRMAAITAATHFVFALAALIAGLLCGGVLLILALPAITFMYLLIDFFELDYSDAMLVGLVTVAVNIGMLIAAAKVFSLF